MIYKLRFLYSNMVTVVAVTVIWVFSWGGRSRARGETDGDSCFFQRHLPFLPSDSCTLVQNQVNCDGWGSSLIVASMETTRLCEVFKSQPNRSDDDNDDESERTTTVASDLQSTSSSMTDLAVSLLARRQRQLLTIDTRNVLTTATATHTSMLQHDCAASASTSSTGTRRSTTCAATSNTVAGADGWISSSTRAGGVGRRSFTRRERTDETRYSPLPTPTPIQESPMEDQDE
jgi:hypothetical protein